MSFGSSLNLFSDNFFYNTPNNYGSLGGINIPSARFYDSPAATFTFYRGYPDRKAILTLYPYDWLEASVFYASFKGQEYGPDFSQDLKDKGFNLKIRIKEQARFPAIALGLNDIGGTGLYSNEYIVSSYSKNKFDFHLGASWGALNHFNHINNPLSFLSNENDNRSSNFGKGGKVSFNNFFSGSKISIFSGINYSFSENLIFKLEYDPTKTPGKIKFKERESDLSFGINLLFENYSFGMNFERGNTASLNLAFRDDLFLKEYQYKRLKRLSKNKYENLIKTLNANNVGVSKIEKSANEVGLTITQNVHRYNTLQQIIDNALDDNNFEEEVIRSYKIAGLSVIDSDLGADKEILFLNNYRGLSHAFSINLRPFIAGREDFLKAALLLEHNAEFIFSENLFFSSNIKYSIIDNFDDLRYPPVDVYPAQVRSDVKKYLNNLGDSPSIGRAQIEYFKTISTNNHLLLSAGIYEEMFSGFGFEYLNYDPKKFFNWGFEAHQVFKRDYEFNFGLLGYKNLTYHLNFFYKNRKQIPFDLKVSFGEYLAGDVGTTLKLSRVFKNGVEFGAFVSKTNVSFENFGEGSFDKGIFFKIPFGSKDSFTNFLWRPLTKDPASKLIKKNDIYSLVDRYSLIEN